MKLLKFFREIVIDWRLYSRSLKPSNSAPKYSNIFDSIQATRFLSILLRILTRIISSRRNYNKFESSATIKYFTLKKITKLSLIKLMLLRVSLSASLTLRVTDRNLSTSSKILLRSKNLLNNSYSQIGRNKWR